MRISSNGPFLLVMLAVLAAVALSSCSDEDSPVEPKATYSWKQEVTGVSEVLYGIGGTAEDNVYVGGTAGRLLHWNGSSFSRLQRMCTSRINAIKAMSETSIWMCGANDSIFHYDGSSWTGYKGNTGVNLYCLFVAAENDIWVAGDGGWTSHFDGSTWSAEQIGTYIWRGLWGTGASSIYIAGFEEVVFWYDGNDWSQITSSGYNNNCQAAWGTADDNVYFAAWSKIFHYDGGLQMTLAVDLSPTRYFGIWGSSKDDIFAVGNDGEIVHWNGTAWSYMTSGTTTDFRNVWGTGPRDVFAIGGSGLILHYCED